MFPRCTTVAYLAVAAVPMLLPMPPEDVCCMFPYCADIALGEDDEETIDFIWMWFGEGDRLPPDWAVN